MRLFDHKVLTFGLTTPFPQYSKYENLPEIIKNAAYSTISCLKLFDIQFLTDKQIQTLEYAFKG